MKKIKYSKVIIWGHPFGSHTHSYVHAAYYKAFSAMGYDTYWFHDGDFPADFDFSNCLFIAEGFADNKIPINDSSCYFVMYCPSPKKYEEAGQYFDVRMAAEKFKDHIQEYSLDRKSATKIGPACYFEPKTNQKVHVKNDYVDYEIDDYNKVYISWATNLLPEEIKFDWIDLPRENVIYFCGSISGGGTYENLSQFTPFIETCKKNGVNFIHNNPWRNALSDEEVIKRTQRSLFGVDIRGTEHLKNKMLTCRTFKNISYGHVGVTNSLGMFEELDGNCVFNFDTQDLFYSAMRRKNDKILAKRGMMIVQENHTYINRINSLLSVI